MPVRDFNPNLAEGYSPSYQIRNGMIEITGMGSTLYVPVDNSVPMKNTPNPEFDRNFLLSLYHSLVERETLYSKLAGN